MKGKWRSTHRKFQRSTVKRDDGKIIIDENSRERSTGSKTDARHEESKPSK